MRLQRLRGEELGGEKEVCKEENDNCCSWAAQSECEKNPAFMLSSCQRSCNLCGGGCAEGCCPPKAALGESEEEIEENEGVEDSKASHLIRLPPPRSQKVDSVAPSGEFFQSTLQGELAKNHREQEDGSEGDDEDYEEEDVTAPFLGALIQWNTLVAFVLGASFAT